MSDPLATLPRLDGIYHYIPFHKMDAALKLGWMPTEILRDTYQGQFAVMCRWIDCACGRGMRVPL